ncbi:MAG: hypothetical protein U0805_10405 [Pirellulales bacterium]
MKIKFWMCGVLIISLLGVAASKYAAAQSSVPIEVPPPVSTAVPAQAPPNVLWAQAPAVIAAPQLRFQYRTAGVSPAIDAAAAELRDATTDEAKSAARKKLTALLNKTFDEDMKGRETELKKVEERVKKLRAQYQKRIDKKQEIVDLQLKVLENEADGLGFFNTPVPGPSPFGANPFGFPQPAGVYGRTPAHDGLIIETQPPTATDHVDPETGEPAHTPFEEPSPNAKLEKTSKSHVDVDVQPFDPPRRAPKRTTASQPADVKESGLESHPE